MPFNLHSSFRKMFCVILLNYVLDSYDAAYIVSFFVQTANFINVLIVWKLVAVSALKT